MNVSSECVDNFHYYNQLELLLLILACIHTSCFVYFGEKCSADRSWKFISVGPGKSWKIIFLKQWWPCTCQVSTWQLCGARNLGSSVSCCYLNLLDAVLKLRCNGCMSCQVPIIIVRIKFSFPGTDGLWSDEATSLHSDSKVGLISQYFSFTVFLFRSISLSQYFSYVFSVAVFNWMYNVGKLSSFCSVKNTTKR